MSNGRVVRLGERVVSSFALASKKGLSSLMNHNPQAYKICQFLKKMVAQ
jgi:hypothetical protein